MSSFAGGIPCVAASPIERHHGLDVAAQIGRQTPGLAEEIVELHLEDRGDALDEIVARRVFLLALSAGMRSAIQEGKNRLTLESKPSQSASIEQHGKTRCGGLRNRSD